MSITDDGISRRQATFDTDPVSLRKQGANIQLPVIEGDKEIKLADLEGDRESILTDIEKQINVVSEVRVKNRTHVIDTKADIDLGVKAISEKAKAHQKQEINKTQIEKKQSVTKEADVVEKRKLEKDRAQLRERNDTIGIGVKAISERAKAQQKQKDNSENNKNISLSKASENYNTENKTSGYLGKKNVHKGEHSKAVNEKGESQKVGQKLDKENVSEKQLSPITVQNKSYHRNKIQTDEKKDKTISVAESKGKAEQILINANKKITDKNSKQKQEGKSKSQKTLPKEHSVKKGHPEQTSLNPTEKEKPIKDSDTKSNTTGGKVKRDISPHKEAINIASGKENKLLGISKDIAQKYDRKKDKTDKTKAKDGVSVIKDTHSASGTTVATGASPKPSEETSPPKETLSKFPVGSAPRVTTLGNVHLNKDKTDTTNTLGNKSKDNQQAFDNLAIVKSLENKLESDRKFPETTKTNSPKTALDLNLLKAKADKTVQEPSVPVDKISMENQGQYRAEGKRAESYDTLYAERNTLLKAEIAYKRRIKQLEDEANDFLKHINQLTSENTQLHARLEALEGDLKGIQNQKTDERILRLEWENNELKKKTQELQNFTDLTKEGDADSVNETPELKAQVIKLQTENQTAKEEILNFKSELLSASRKLHALEKEKNSLADSVTAVESEKLDEIGDLRKTHSKLQKENKSQKDKIGELEKKVNSLEFENKTLSESLDQKKSELDELLVVMKDENKFDNEIKNLKNQVMKLEKEKKELELKHNSEKRKLEEELGETRSKYEKSNTELLEVKSKMTDLMSKNKYLSTDNKTLTMTRDSQKKEIDELKAEIERLKNELMTVQKKLDSLKSETENATTSLKDANQTLEDTNKDLQSIVSEKEDQISKLIAQVDTLRKEKVTEKQNFENEKETLTSEIDRLQVFEKHMNAMERELKQFVEKLEESEKQKAQLASELEDKEYTIGALEKQVFELNLKIETLTKRIGQIDRDKREMENEKREWEVKRDKINDIESSNKRLMEENRRLRGSLEDKHFLDKNTATQNEKPPRGREAWIEDPIPIASLQKAVFVENKNGKKKVQINPEPVIQKRRVPFTRSSPAKGTKPPVPRKNIRTSLSPSRSLEDVRKSPLSPADSNPSLPELRQDSGLTYGYSYTQGYSQIHRNRIRAAAHKRVY